MIKIEYRVTAYDESGITGYGENRSREFDNERDAVGYAKSLEKRFHAVVYRHISVVVSSVSEKVYSYTDDD